MHRPADGVCVNVLCCVCTWRLDGERLSLEAPAVDGLWVALLDHVPLGVGPRQDVVDVMLGTPRLACIPLG